MLQELRALVDDLVRDVVGRVGEEARDRAVSLAIVQYGKDRPRTRVSDLVAQDAPVPRHLDLPEGWDVEASIALTIEYPVGHVPPRIMPRHAWAVLVTPAGQVLGLPRAIPAGATCRLTWTLPHEIGEDVDTLPPGDREAVAQYAAAVLLDQVAAMTSGDHSSVIQADAVDHQEAGPNYAARASTARRRYHDLLGIDPKRVQAASVTVNPPLPSTTGEHRLLFRRRRG
ncbi:MULTISPECIES: hypothetical protein [unclassified Xanthobacter]|uniref:hypothetical protein n=1 Tax=unclassified Xanthobacter TaxID=2623496 RepID=UPI001EDF413E|nr:MULTISPECIES: hypothetical protein [unclassified Xanthobacter]